MNEYKETISCLGKNLNNKNIEPIIIGGWAINLLGIVRQTVDFDMMIFTDNYEIIKEELLNMKFKFCIKTPLFARFETDKHSLTTIDILFANSRTYNLIKEQSSIVDIFGAKFHLPTPLHIIAMKLHSIDQGQKVRYNKDFNDIISLVNHYNIDVTTLDFKELCFKYSSETIYKRILEWIMK